MHSSRIHLISGSPRGFSLVELTLAMAIGGILLLALGSALMLSTSALDTGADSSAVKIQAAEVGSQIGAELSVASAVPVQTSKDLFMSVPDRDGDGRPETIEYTWSGVRGAPLLRSYNGSTPVAVIPSVNSIDLTTITRPPAVSVESAEQVLMQCDTVAGAASYQTNIDDPHSAAQYFRPTMPSGATEWKITRVSLYLKQNNSNAKVINIYIRDATATLTPGTTALASAITTAGAASTGGGWLTFALPVSGLLPTQGVCITMEDTVDKGTVIWMGWQNGTAQPFNTHAMTGNGAAPAVWAAPTDTKDYRFIVYGTITTLVEP